MRNMIYTKENFNNIIGNRIWDIRIKMNLSREDLAEMADISPKYLYEIENGRKTCSLYIGYKICKGLKIDMEYLLNEELAERDKDDISKLYQHLQREQQKQVSNIIKIIYDMVEHRQ